MNADSGASPPGVQEPSPAPVKCHWALLIMGPAHNDYVTRELVLASKVCKNILIGLAYNCSVLAIARLGVLQCQQSMC